jgi:hypothetical protein
MIMKKEINLEICRNEERNTDRKEGGRENIGGGGMKKGFRIYGGKK